MVVKRAEYPEIAPYTLVQNCKFTVDGHEYKVTAYGDDATKKFFELRPRTYGMIKPDAYKHIGTILDMTYKAGFRFDNMKMFKFALANAEEFYAEHKGRPFFEGLTKFMSSGYAVGMNLVAECAIEKWRGFIGPTNSENARKSAPNSIRALFGTDGQRNATHGSDAPGSANRELGFIFDREYPTTATFKDCACVIVMPHAVESGHLGKIIETLLAKGVMLTALEMKTISKELATEFFKDKKVEIEKAIAGKAVVLEVTKENVTKELPGILGEEKSKNEVYFSETAETGVSESKFFFELHKK